MLFFPCVPYKGVLTVGLQVKSMSRLIEGCVRVGVCIWGEAGAVGDCLPVALQL